MTSIVHEDVTGFQDLASQLNNRRDSKPIPEAKLDPRDLPRKEETSEEGNNNLKRYTFKKGEQTFEVDEDAELEFMADKQSVKLKLSDLKDRAAGDVAIKNRMHSLAEEKKKVQATLKEFGKIAEKDPLKALEYISKEVKNAGTDFEYDKYLAALAKQAEQLARMDDKERRAHLAEKKLEEVEGDLSQKQREDLVRQKAQESIQNLGITESQFNQAAQLVLGNSVLMEGIDDESDFFSTVEDMVVKANNQKVIASAINRVDPAEATNTDLIIELADIVEELLPDGTESDIQDIVAELLHPKVKTKVEQRLSNKQRTSMPMEHMRSQGASDYQLLIEQLKEKRPEKSSRR